jgi:hypothetical protein
MVQEVLKMGARLEPSVNDYDWLGTGIYFWEYGPERALRWATEISERRPDQIRDPAVLGAVIQLGVCFDLLDVRFTEYLGQAYRLFRALVKRQGKRVPRNTGRPGERKELVLRRRDCAVLNWAIPELERERGLRFDSVRGVFQEGATAFPGSAIRLRSHIQVAVRNPDCMLGYFAPTLDGNQATGNIPA